MDKKTFHLTEFGCLVSQIVNSSSGENPYTLFLGAGASVSSGISGINDLIIEWKKEVFCHIKELKIPMPSNKNEDFDKWKEAEYNDWLSGMKYYLNSSSEYGTLFQYLRKTRAERQMYIEKLVSKKSPSPGYIYLAGLIHAEKFNRILTTNFDDLLNDALVKYYKIKPINCAFDSAVNSFNNSSLRPKIIKLHGDFLYDNIKNTDDELLDLSENMEDKMIEMCEDKGLIVIGYSGADESIMAPIRENLRKNKKFLGKGLHWCVFSKKDAANYIKEDDISESLRTMKKRYPDRVFLYSISGFDKFMESAFAGCNLSLPDTILYPHHNSVANDFYESCENLEQRENLTTQSKEFMNEALKSMKIKPDEIKIKIREANIIWRNGVELRDEGEYVYSIKKFEESIEKVSEVLENNISNSLKLQALSRQLGCHIGISKCLIALKRNNDYNEEVKKSYKIIKEAMKLEDYIVKDKEKDIFASILYNNICILGTEAKKQTKAPEVIIIKKEVQLIVDKLGVSSLGRAKLEKLKDDEDTNIKYIRELLG